VSLIPLINEHRFLFLPGLRGEAAPVDPPRRRDAAMVVFQTPESLSLSFWSEAERTRKIFSDMSVNMSK